MALDKVETVLSTVAAGSDVGRILSCFRLRLLIVRDDYSPYDLFRQLIDGLMELCWVRGSTLEASKAEYLSFLQEQKQIECTSTRSCPDVGSILSLCSSEAGFRARKSFYRKGVTNMPR